MPENKHINEAVWQSARNLLDCQVNLNNLCEAFDEVECDDGDLIIEFEGDDEGSVDWVCPVWNTYYKVSKRPRKKKAGAGWITLAIQLTCDEGINENLDGEWAHAHHAKVIAGYSPSKNWSDAWEFDTGAPNSAGIYTDCITKDYHWVWEDDKKYGFFAVPLDVLTIMDNVRAFLAEPLHHLASGGSFEDVLGGIKDKLCIPPRQ